MSIFEQIDEANDAKLLSLIEEWMKDHPNPYSRDEYEDAYWTMHDLRNLVLANANLVICKGIFKRYYHKYR